MVKDIDVGVLGVQGAVSEHLESMRKALKEKNICGNVSVVNNEKNLNAVDALILPGGESTTISRLIQESNLRDVLCARIKNHNLPIMGTCAGCVILASEISDKRSDIFPLNAISMQVARNAFGRQKQSFEKQIEIKGFENSFNAVFIRAPIIKKIWSGCNSLSEIEEGIIMVQEKEFLAMSFHPELTNDTRVHCYFIDMILDYM
ncbi:MAG: pyridoxal 5'-phosphate synthase glutaminase subunit PdxT [Candidatus Thermoplasmatota archaeon]|nr:pyridoxal 5'-phosphate synthase glutaminase subunit PdxT [Candidatus Thermoplasmatota archaeon]